MYHTKEQQEQMAAIVEREILIIDAYNALKARDDNVTTRTDLWVLLGSLTNQELKTIILTKNQNYENAS